MVIVALLAAGAAFLGGALHQVRGVMRRWSDGDRSTNQATIATMSLIALYGVLFLSSGMAALVGARPSATTILTFFAVTVLVGVVFAAASLFSTRRAWSFDNDLRAASSRPGRRHWMPPLLVAVLWLLGGSVVVIGLMLLMAGMVVGDGAPDPAADALGPTAVNALMGTVMAVAAAAAGIQKWRLYREEKQLQVSDRAMTRQGRGGEHR